VKSKICRDWKTASDHLVNENLAKNACCHICKGVFIENTSINWHPTLYKGCHKGCRVVTHDECDEKCKCDSCIGLSKLDVSNSFFEVDFDIPVPREKACPDCHGTGTISVIGSTSRSRTIPSYGGVRGAGYIRSGKLNQHSGEKYWQSDEPSQKQLKALEDYGYDGETPETKGDASDLISKIKYSGNTRKKAEELSRQYPKYHEITNKSPERVSIFDICKTCGGTGFKKQ